MFALLALFTASIATHVINPQNSLQNAVMFGYQGWFGALGEGTTPGYGWRHWSRDGQVPKGGDAAFDLWPDLSEYSEDALFPTNLKFENGETAKLFSADVQSVTALHAKWLEDYDLDGFMLQRFVNEIQAQKGAAFDFRNTVTAHMQEEMLKRKHPWNVMYDVSGATESAIMDSITKDWEYLESSLNISSSRSYTRYQGKPVVSIWGFGFTGEHPPSDPQVALNIIQWFQNKGIYVIGGVPFYWRSGTQDSRPNFGSVYSAFDCLSPWSVGRYNSIKSYRSLFSVQVDDMKLTNSRRQGYAPVLFPGFSWSNLQQDPSKFNEIPRQGGRFLQSQISRALTLRPTFFYIAMFDEVNEGTAMFKAVGPRDQAPVEQGGYKFLTLDEDAGSGLSSDFYLKQAADFTSSSHARDGGF